MTLAGAVAVAATAVATLTDVSLTYGRIRALDRITLTLPSGCMAGLIGPDGVGKSSLLALLAGARAVQEGGVQVLGGDMAQARHRRDVCRRIAYMPQGLGGNLYATLTVEENLQFFGSLFGHAAAERRRRIDQLTTSTGLQSFLARAAGQLSGGMRQKLALCCALIHDPDLLILDEPTTGVDPLSRRQFWDLIRQIRAQRPGMSVVVATSYLEEANAFDWLVALEAGKVLTTGTPADLRARSTSTTLEEAFIALLPEPVRRGHHPVVVPPLAGGPEAPVAIEARGLTRRFGSFVAVDHVDFRIRQGEIFGFVGSNGCGKSTTMKMLTGLLVPSAGEARLFGRPVDATDINTRRQVGYLSQTFSLYSELTVRQNLVLHGRLFGLPDDTTFARTAELLDRCGLQEVAAALPGDLPLGIRQRLSLAVAVMHRPAVLILDEPTSGVDPLARDVFWQLLVDLSRQDRVTIFISTHFMDEAARCDRIALMDAGRVLVTDSPAAVMRAHGAATLEEAFIACLGGAAGGAGPASAPAALTPAPAPADRVPAARPPRWFAMARAASYARRETLELLRDPVRATLALVGTAYLLVVMGYGISLDVENLAFAVLDEDQTVLSQNYALNLAGSRYFIERPPIADFADLDRRMRAGELALAVEIPPGFARATERGQATEVAAWIDGAMPTRAETVRGYAQGMHQLWLAQTQREQTGTRPAAEGFLQTRFRYNPDVRSLPAMVPAVIPLLLMMIPAVLAALSVVREKELGSIINLYVTPVTRSEFVLGKQSPYIVLAMVNFLLMTAMAVTLFGVPVKGSFLTLAAAALVYVVCSTGIGMLCSAFTHSQVAALFLTIIATIIPCVQFAGLINPVSSLQGAGAVIGSLYPATHFLAISRGTFNKALGFASLASAFWPLLVAIPVIEGLAILLLRKQER